MSDPTAHQYDGSKLKEYIDKFPLARILVIGDIILDKYVWGDVCRISPEAPVPVVEVVQETKMLGGAANVIQNIATLGAKPLLCGVVGDDWTGREIIQKCKELGLSVDGIVTGRNRPTSIKTRVVARNQQVVRFDREKKGDVGTESLQQLLESIKTNLNDLDAIVVADYGKGVVSSDLMKGLRALVKDASVVIAVDPKTGNFDYYHEVDVITPNHHEAGNFCGFEISDKKSLVRAGMHMLDKLNCRSILITQGKSGMTLFEKSGEITHIPTVAKQVFDVTGAGDTVISIFSLGLASGLDLKSSAILSNFAAGIVVGKLGTAAVEIEELKGMI